MTSSSLLLMLDDDPEDAFLVRTAIKRTALPIQFEYFQTGQAFCEYIRTISEQYLTTHSLLLLLDLNMPGKTGMDWLQELRADALYKEVVIVIFSTSNLDEDKARCLALGANAYIDKPDRVEDLATKIVSLYQTWLAPKA